MASETLQAWIELPPLAAPPLSLAEWLLQWWPWALLLLIASMLWWWRLRQPRQRLLRTLAQLRRALQQGRLDERQALYMLAQGISGAGLPALPLPLQQTLESRFQRSPATEDQVLTLLQQLQAWVRK